MTEKSDNAADESQNAMNPVLKWMQDHAEAVDFIEHMYPDQIDEPEVNEQTPNIPKDVE